MPSAADLNQNEESFDENNISNDPLRIESISSQVRCKIFFSFKLPLE